MSDRDGNFLSRWSRLKERSRAGAPAGREESAADPAACRRTAEGLRTPLPSGSDGLPAPPAQADPGRVDEAAVSGGPSAAAAPGDAQRASDGAETPLPAVESLRPDSDFRPFMRAGIEASTRNAALKRLFADPQFNVMDGLDVYIDDYGKTEPIPEQLLRRLVREHAHELLDARTDAGPAQARPLPDCGASSAPAEGPLSPEEDRLAPAEDPPAPAEDRLAQGPDAAHEQCEPKIGGAAPSGDAAQRHEDDPDAEGDPCTGQHRG